MDEVGYDAEWDCLNSKDFGVPQSRDRVFVIAHLRGGRTRKVFPLGEDSRKDIVGGVVVPTLTTRYPASQREGTYIEEVRKREGATGEMKQVAQMYGTEKEPNPQAGRVYSHEGVSPALDTCSGGNRMPKIAVPVLTPQDRGVTISIDLKSEKSSTRRGMFKKEYTGALDTNSNIAVNQKYRIRKLTPKECWRLQSFPDWAFDRAKAAGVSDSQLYKQAGNSVTVNVIYEIARRLA